MSETLNELVINDNESSLTLFNIGSSFTSNNTVSLEEEINDILGGYCSSQYKDIINIYY